MSFHILTVCTGNICRSPAMHRILEHLYAEYPEVTVSSAGTYAHDGEDMQPPMKDRVREYGADASGCVATQLTAQMISEADLILAATSQHVADILATAETDEDKVFLVRELGHILTRLPELTEENPRGTAGAQDLGAPDTAASTAGVPGPGAPDTAPVDQQATISERLRQVISWAAQQREQPGNGRRDDDVVDPYMLPGSVYDESFAQLSKPLELLAQHTGAS